MILIRVQSEINGVFSILCLWTIYNLALSYYLEILLGYSLYKAARMEWWEASFIIDFMCDSDGNLLKLSTHLAT